MAAWRTRKVEKKGCLARMNEWMDEWMNGKIAGGKYTRIEKISSSGSTFYCEL